MNGKTVPCAADPQAAPRAPLVEADWLRAHAADVVVLDASVERVIGHDGVARFEPGYSKFLQSHVPGARFADIMGAFSDTTAPYPFTCPTPQGLEQAARALGLNSQSDIVVYDTLGGAYAARLWCVLREYGHERVRVLNGGLAAWEAAGGEIATGPAGAVPPGDFVPGPARGTFVDTAAVLALIGGAPVAQVPLLCGLRAVQYRGDDGTGPRRGHIPTSLSLPYPDLLGPDGRLESASVRRALAALGLGVEITPVLYCGGGINAAGLALALALVGVSDSRIYDDSMNHWLADPALPVVCGPMPGGGAAP